MNWSTVISCITWAILSTFIKAARWASELKSSDITEILDGVWPNCSLSYCHNEEVDELFFPNIIRNTIENNLSKNINNIVKKSVSADEDAIIDIMSLLIKDIILKYLCQLRVALERMMPKEALIFEEDV